jgi:hypothetical protein
MRVAIAGAGVAAPVAKSIELLDIAQGNPGLLRNPGA